MNGIIQYPSKQSLGSEEYWRCWPSCVFHFRSPPMRPPMIFQALKHPSSSKCSPTLRIGPRQQANSLAKSIPPSPTFLLKEAISHVTQSWLVICRLKPLGRKSLLRGSSSFFGPLYLLFLPLHLPVVQPGGAAAILENKGWQVWWRALCAKHNTVERRRSQSLGHGEPPISPGLASSDYYYYFVRWTNPHLSKPPLVNISDTCCQIHF